MPHSVKQDVHTNRVLSGLDCRITRASGTLDKRSDSFCSRNRGRSRDRRAGSGRRKRDLDGDDAGYDADYNYADYDAHDDDAGRPWHDPGNGRSNEATEGKDAEANGCR